MLNDHFVHRVDEKGRMSFPSSYRKQLPSELKVLKSPTDDCLMVFSAEHYEAWINELFESKGGYNPTSKSHRNLKRYLTTHTTDVEIDKAGRIGLRLDLRASVGIEGQAVIAGNDDHVEIWSTANWAIAEGEDDSDSFGDFFGS